MFSFSCIIFIHTYKKNNKKNDRKIIGKITFTKK